MTDFTPKFSLRQIFVAKGGNLRTNYQNNRVRIVVEIGGDSFEFITGMDLKGFRCLEERVQDQLAPADGFDVDYVSASNLGVDLAFLKNHVIGKTLPEKAAAYSELCKEQRAGYDENGFFKKVKEIKDVSFAQFADGAEGGAVVFPNQSVKRMFGKSMEGGSWDSTNEFRYIFDQDSEDGCSDSEQQIVALLKLWKQAPYVEMSGFDEIEPVVVDSLGDGRKEMGIGGLYRSLSKKAITSLKEEERENLYWGGANPGGLSGKRRKNFIPMLFAKVEPNRDYALEDLCALLRSQTDNIPFEEYGLEVNDMDALIAGQMVRAAGQLRYQPAKDSIRYVPRPQQWFDAQKRIHE